MVTEYKVMEEQADFRRGRGCAEQIFVMRQLTAKMIEQDKRGYTLLSVGGYVTNGSNHRILHQPDQVSKTDNMARGTKVLFAATSDRLPSHPAKDGMEEPLTAVSP